MKDFITIEHTYEDITHTIYKKGTGRGVIIIHELPGMVKECVNFARRISTEGFTVYLPLLFDQPDIPFSTIKTLENLTRLCIHKEFSLWENNRTSPIVEWLKSLSRLAHAECGGTGVGAIGMCLTGGFAIPMLVEPSLMAPVLSQPSLPLLPDSKGRKSLGCSDKDYAGACRRIKKEQIQVRGYKFSHDVLSDNQKFDTLQADLGELFVGMTIDSGLFNSHHIPIYSHSVFTVHYNDAEGHPTQEAYKTLIQYFKDRLYSNQNGFSRLS
jgi:dienelactone hydrolase